MVDVASTTAHPLDSLAADEIRAAVSVVRESGQVNDGALFAMVTLDEPSRDTLASHRSGDPVERRVRLIVLPGPEAAVVEVVVSLASGRMVQIDPWPTGTFGVAHEEGRRIFRCLSYYRDSPTTTATPVPSKGSWPRRRARGEVLEVVDYGVVPSPRGGSYYPRTTGRCAPTCARSTIVQPEGPSFTVEGNLVRWQRWSMRVSMDPLEGLVLHTIGYEDGGPSVPILYRASVSEMVVPYGDPGPMHGWKNAFDVGEWGLGRMANSLTLGCDCLGEITYLDAVFSDEHGKPYTRANAICIHEEDYGILWKHVDMNSGRTEVRRSRRLVVSSIATVGNYEYGFYWYFYLDGTMQLEVKLTGIMSTHGGRPGRAPPHASMVAPGLAAPFHQHLFNVRLDIDVDGPDNEVYEVDFETLAARRGQPVGQRLPPTATCSSPSWRPGATSTRPEPHWRFVNPGSRPTPWAEPVAYKLVPGSTPTLLAGPSRASGSGPASPAQPVGHPLRSRERRAAGDYPNQHAGGDGLPGWTAADRPTGRHRHRGLAHLRGHPLAPARGLAGHARGVLRLPPHAGRVLRPQSPWLPRPPPAHRRLLRLSSIGEHVGAAGGPDPGGRLSPAAPFDWADTMAAMPAPRVPPVRRIRRRGMGHPQPPRGPQRLRHHHAARAARAVGHAPHQRRRPVRGAHRGSGEKAFCTGLDRADIGNFDDLPPGKLPGYNTPWDFDDPGKSVCPKSNDLWKPVIAAVNGMACGGAFYILGEVDFIIAAEHATFFDPHVTYGMPAAFEPIFLLHKMPFQEVMRWRCWVPTSVCRPARAHQIGFVSEVVPADELREHTRWAAQAIADQPALAVGGTVRALWTGLELSRRQALDHAYLFTHVGTDRALLEQGQERFTSGTRIEWRLR
jgi:primary-amine oxidase